MFTHFLVVIVVISLAVSNASGVSHDHSFVSNLQNIVGFRNHGMSAVSLKELHSRQLLQIQDPSYSSSGKKHGFFIQLTASCDNHFILNLQKHSEKNIINQYIQNMLQCLFLNLNYLIT